MIRYKNTPFQAIFRAVFEPLFGRFSLFFTRRIGHFLLVFIDNPPLFALNPALFPNNPALFPNNPALFSNNPALFSIKSPYTRIIEHKHFEMFGQEVYDCKKTVISREYSTEYKEGMEPYYTVNDERNNALADQYRALAAQEKNVIFGGRLAEYKYYDMAPIVEKVLGMEIE